MRVYVSSTFVDLQEYRAAALTAIQRLGHVPVGMEAYVADPRPPVDKCLRDVETCQLYVGIFAWRYGYVPEGRDASITELEYRQAIEKKIPALVFLLDPDTPWPPASVDHGELGQRVAALRDDFRTRAVVSSFRSPDNLAAQVTAAVALQAEIANQASVPLAPRTGPPEAGPRVVGLPFVHAGAWFRGRRDEIGRLQALLRDSRTKVIWVVGRAGTGKTALLGNAIGGIEIAGAEPGASAPPDGIAYLSCRHWSPVTIDTVFHHLSQLLSPAQEQEFRQCPIDAGRPLVARIERLLAFFREGRFLLVLDEFERLLAEDDTVADPDIRQFMETCLIAPHGLRIIATSRERPLLPPRALHSIRTVALDRGLPPADAIALLRDLDPDGDLGLRDEADATLARAVERCHGIPRALESMAGLVQADPNLTLSTLLASPGIFDSQVTENLIVEQHRRLSATDVSVAQALAVLNRPVPEVALRYVLLPFRTDVEVRQALQSLVRRLVVAHRRDTETFDLHPLDQEYLYAKLPVEGDLTRMQLHRRAASYFESLPLREGAKDLADIEPQLEARRHHFLAGNFQRAADIASDWTRGLLRLGHYRIVEHILDETVRTASGYPLAAAFLGKASIAGLHNDWAAAIDHNRRAVASLSDPGTERDQRLRGIALTNTAYACCHLPDLTEADRWLRQGLDLAAELCDAWLEGKCWSISALRALYNGDFEAAIEHGARSLALHRALPLDQAGTAPSHTRDIMGMAYLGQGRLPDAQRLFEESLAMRLELKNRFGLGHSYHNLSLVRAESGDIEAALEDMRRSLTVRTEIDHVEGLVETLCGFGMLYGRAGQVEAAVDHCERARQLLGIVPGGALADLRFDLVFGAVLIAADRPAEALEFLSRAHAQARRLGLRPEQARSAAYLASLKARSGDEAAANALREEALTVALGCGAALVAECRRVAPSVA